MQNARNATRWTLLQGMSVKQEDKKSQSSPGNTQDVDDTHIDECGFIQPNPPVVNMLKVINHTSATSGTLGSHTHA